MVNSNRATYIVGRVGQLAHSWQQPGCLLMKGEKKRLCPCTVVWDIKMRDSIVMYRIHTDDFKHPWLFSTPLHWPFLLDSRQHHSFAAIFCLGFQQQLTGSLNLRFAVYTFWSPLSCPSEEAVGMEETEMWTWKFCRFFLFLFGNSEHWAGVAGSWE